MPASPQAPGLALALTRQAHDAARASGKRLHLGAKPKKAAPAPARAVPDVAALEATVARDLAALEVAVKAR
jgi:hypothetical protein